MRTMLLAIFAFVILVFVAPSAARDPRGSSACPLPSVELGTQCVLQHDAELTDTMWIPSGKKLNCQGHHLTPHAAGLLDDPRTTTNEFVASQPELAMFVHQSDDVKIQNCVIEGFDFGIIVANSKVDDPRMGGPANNKILGNTINVRTNAIDIIKSDAVLISDNQITYASERGRGIVVDYDSDGNEIVGNTILSTDTASTGQVRQLPGGPFVSSTPIMDNGIHVLQSDKPLQNFVVGGMLFQIPASDLSKDFEDSGRSDHNLIEDNDIIDFGGSSSCTLDPATPCASDAACAGKGVCLLKQNSGIAFNIRASDAIARHNRVSGRKDRGISVGGNAASTTIVGFLPGTCRLDRRRLCATSADCNIAGVDTANLGPCDDAANKTFDGFSQRIRVEDNTLTGDFAVTAMFANSTREFVLRRNVVTGGTSSIQILGSAVDGLVERNILSGASYALWLLTPPTFTHTIRLNDFINYGTAVRTQNTFVTSTDLASDAGNYWGLPCPGFDPNAVRFENGLVNPNVFDSKPFGQAVALTPDGSLPAPCSSLRRPASVNSWRF